MYIRKIFDYIFSPQDNNLSQDYWKNFKSSANLLNKFDKSEEFQLLFNRAYVFFEKQNSKEFQIVVEPLETQMESMVFTISELMEPEIEFNTHEETVGFVLKVDKDIWINIEFVIFEEDYSDSVTFKEILGRLIIENKYTESYSEERHRSLMDSLFKIGQR
jgi:hypothetical protein